MRNTPILSVVAFIAAIAPSLALLSKRGTETLDIFSDDFTNIMSSQVMVDQDVFSRPYPHHPPASLSVLSNNVFLLGAVPWEQKTRAELISKAEYIKHHDVVVLQECFRNEYCEDLKQGLRSEYPHATPSIGDSKAGWLSTSGKFIKLSPENGGVAIISKWPIAKMRQFIFMDGCGWDKFSNKGVAYAELDIHGTKVHVFGTHMQSDDSLCHGGQAAQIRAQALDDFITLSWLNKSPRASWS